jgi:hypothetical protein
MLRKSGEEESEKTKKFLKNEKMRMKIHIHRERESGGERGTI